MELLRLAAATGGARGVLSAADVEAQRRERVEEEREQRAAIDKIETILGSVPLKLCLAALMEVESKYLLEMEDEYYEEANEQQEDQLDEHYA